MTERSYKTKGSQAFTVYEGYEPIALCYTREEAQRIVKAAKLTALLNTCKQLVADLSHARQLLGDESIAVWGVSIDEAKELIETVEQA